VAEAVEIDYIDMPEARRGKYQYFTEACMNKLHAAGYTRSFFTLEDAVTDYVDSYLSKREPSCIGIT
jgi:ADP-L-glycero-D-manno-heptose 6-epimerase